jgi:hypothetical protein
MGMSTPETRADTMAEEDQASSGEQATIRFNVGGKLYKVSRSLIEQRDTMLARLTSETWQREDSGNQDIFIDRDGERFAYVLDNVCRQFTNVLFALFMKDILK